MPEQIYINLDIVRRDLDIPPTALVERMRAMTSLGFEVEIGADENCGDGILVIRRLDLTTYENDFTFNFAAERSTEVAVVILKVLSGDCCEQCAERYVEDLDFSLLASSTTELRIPEVSA